MANTELFRKIHEIISADPMKLEMSNWERRPIDAYRDPDTTLEQDLCGTTRCVAGWAVALTTGTPLFVGFSGVRHPAVKELFRAHGLTFDDDFVDLGAELLGLDKTDAYRLFFSSDLRAATVVGLFAEGQDEEALSYLNVTTS
jgi:hypothetical protein